MDLTNKKACIITCGVNGHYPVGVDRLAKSLNFVGWAGCEILRKELPEGCPPHEGNGQYNFKVYCFEEAFKQGFTHVLWCDCSLYAIENPMPIFDYISDKGLYFFKSGYSLAQTATDKLCNYADVDRKDLLNVSEFATGLVGIRIDNPNGKKFFEEWEKYMQDGMFGGSRSHDYEDSEDPLFLFSRQDQSAASMVLHKMGIKTAGETEDFLSYERTGYNPAKIIFFVGGIG